MTDRDRQINVLAELLENLDDLPFYTYKDEAEYLIDEYGVIVPPCKVGQTVWDLHQRYNGTFVIQEGKISMITQKADKSWHLRITVNSSVWGFTPNEIGERYFLTKEEAEKKLHKLETDTNVGSKKEREG